MIKKNKIKNNSNNNNWNAVTFRLDIPVITYKDDAMTNTTLKENETYYSYSMYELRIKQKNK